MDIFDAHNFRNRSNPFQKFLDSKLTEGERLSGQARNGQRTIAGDRDSFQNAGRFGGALGVQGLGDVSTVTKRDSMGRAIEQKSTRKSEEPVARMRL